MLNAAYPLTKQREELTRIFYTLTEGFKGTVPREFNGPNLVSIEISLKVKAPLIFFYKQQIRVREESSVIRA